MRIALIHPYLNDRGGSQRYVIEIANNLIKLGIEVDLYAYVFNKNKCYPELTTSLNIIHLRSSNIDNDFKSKGIKKSFLIKQKLISFCQNPIFSTIYYELAIDYLYSTFIVNKQANELEKLISNVHSYNKYDLIFSHEEPLSLYAAIKFKIRNNVPIYWFCYDTIAKWFLEWNPLHSKRLFRPFILNKLFFLYDKFKVKKHVDLIAVLDLKMKERVKKLYKLDAVLRRGAIATNVFDFKFFNTQHFLNNRFKKESERVVICLVSRFVQYRRLIDIFELIKKLPKHLDERVQFYINAPITDKNYFNYCKDNYENIFQKDNVVIDVNPFSSDSEMYSIYLSSDIFIFPNEKQTWGHAPLEAMSCSCMAIVSDDCGIHEIVKKIADTVYRVGDTNSLLNILSTVVLNKSYSDIASLQRQYIEENLTWPKICSEFISDFKSILDV